MQKSVASILGVEEVIYFPKYGSSRLIRNVRTYTKIAKHDSQENCPNSWENLYTSHNAKEV
jgi:hypothetical protein